MSSERNFTIAHLIAALIVFVGFSARLLNLGTLPLSDFEANAALQARTLSSGAEAVADAADPGYATLTGLVFFVLGQTGFAARLLPAILGTLVVGLPLLFRRHIGWMPALVMAALLAVDPLFVNVSRVAGGPMLAMGFLLGALALRANGQRTSWVSIFAALALLAGQEVFFGILTLGFTVTALMAFGYDPAGLFSPKKDAELIDSSAKRFDWTSFGLTLLLAATGFMLNPGGIAAFAESLMDFFMSWVQPSTVSPVRIFATFFAVQWLPLFFAVFHLIRTNGEEARRAKMLLIWFLTSFGLVLVYPGRQVADLIWVSMPLWALAAFEIGKTVYWTQRPLYRLVIVSSAVVVFAISIWVNITALTYVIPDDPQFNLRLMIIGGTLILLVLAFVLAGMTWGGRYAMVSAVWAAALLMLFSIFNGLWGSAHRTAVSLRDPWLSVPGAGEAELLTDTIQSLGSWFSGSARDLDIRYNLESPSLVWALRNFTNVRKGSVLAGEDFPAVVITGDQVYETRLGAAYRGQSLTWRVYPVWEEMGFREWVRWVIFREVPAVNEDVIIWVRADLFLAERDTPLTDLFPLDAIEEEPEDYIPLENVEDILPSE